jgi:hypothetical protein
VNATIDLAGSVTCNSKSGTAPHTMGSTQEKAEFIGEIAGY